MRSPRKGYAAWDNTNNPVAGEPTDLFVYGTLTDPALRLRLLGRSPSVIEALLKNYTRRDGEYPYLLPAEGHEVPGWIVREVTGADLERLDNYEVATPQFFAGAVRRLYIRDLAEVMTLDGRRVRCWVYMPNLADWPPAWK